MAARNGRLSTLASACLLLLAPLAGCKKKAATDGTPDAAVASAKPTASAAVPIPKPQIPKPLIPLSAPEGPVLAVLAGKGLGPVRLGATRETVERLMEAPCEESTPDRCRYVKRGIELLMEDGKVQRILVHRSGRPVQGGADGGEPRTYGTFNGAIPPDLRLFMIPSALEEALGKPKRVVQHSDGGVEAQNLVEEHYYDGMVLEYDRLPNGKVALGGIRIPK